MLSLAIFFSSTSNPRAYKSWSESFFMINSAGFRVYNFPKKGEWAACFEGKLLIVKIWAHTSLVLLNVSCEWVLGKNFYLKREPVSGYRWDCFPLQVEKVSSEGSSGSSGRLQLSISGTSRGGESQGPDQVGVRSEVAETRQTSTGRPLRECREKVLFDFILCPDLHQLN